MTPATIVLLHSPLVGPQSWGDLPRVLDASVATTIVADVGDDESPPYAARYIARAALQVRNDAPDGPLALVGHSGAGPLLPQVGAALSAQGRHVGAYVFLDAGIPRAGASRLDLLGTEDPELGRALRAQLERGRRFPDWTVPDLAAETPDPDAAGAVVAALRPRQLEFFTEPLPMPGDWPDAPCGYLRLSPAYDASARQAALRGWPVRRREDGHFGMITDPEGVGRELAALLVEL